MCGCRYPVVIEWGLYNDFQWTTVTYDGSIKQNIKRKGGGTYEGMYLKPMQSILVGLAIWKYRMYEDRHS